MLRLSLAGMFMEKRKRLKSLRERKRYVVVGGRNDDARGTHLRMPACTSGYSALETS